MQRQNGTLGGGDTQFGGVTTPFRRMWHNPVTMHQRGSGGVKVPIF